MQYKKESLETTWQSLRKPKGYFAFFTQLASFSLVKLLNFALNFKFKNCVR